MVDSAHHDHSEESIKVTFQLRLIDQLHSAFSLPRKIFNISFFGFLVFGGFLALFNWYSYGYIFSKYFFTLGIFVAALVPALLLTTYITNTVLYSRMTEAQKQVTYDINAERICVSDKTGNRTELPWTSITHFHERRSGYVLEFRPLGARWIPKRILSNEERTLLISYAQSK